MTPQVQVETVPPLTARQWGTIAVLTGAVMLLAIDGTVLSLAVPRLTADLAPSATELLWIGDVYSFVLAGLLVTMGNVADRIGRRRLLLIGSTGFGLASLLAAFAPTAGVLIAARVFLGLFGATIMPRRYRSCATSSGIRCSAPAPSRSGRLAPPAARQWVRSSEGSCWSTSGGGRCS